MLEFSQVDQRDTDRMDLSLQGRTGDARVPESTVQKWDLLKGSLMPRLAWCHLANQSALATSHHYLYCVKDSAAFSILPCSWRTTLSR